MLQRAVALESGLLEPPELVHEEDAAVGTMRERGAHIQCDIFSVDSVSNIHSDRYKGDAPRHATCEPDARMPVAWGGSSISGRWPAGPGSAASKNAHLPCFLCFFCLWLLLAPPLVASGRNRTHYVTNCLGHPCRDSCASFDWQSYTPIDLVELLVREHARSAEDGRGGSFCVVDGEHWGWVAKDDIPRLLALVDSEKPCAGVISTLSSSFGGASTIGHEAAVLIIAFQKGHYPFFLDSREVAVDKDALRRWWQDYPEEKE